MPQDKENDLLDPVWIELLKWKMDRIGFGEKAQSIVMDLAAFDGRTYTIEEICEKHETSPEEVERIMRRLLGTACVHHSKLKDYLED